MTNRSAWCASALTVSLLAAAADAELFRCTGPDGQTIFTDQKDTCPGAEPFEPSGVVLEAPTPGGTERAAPPAAGPSLADDALAAQAEQWKRRKLEAEQAVERIRQRRDWMKPYVGHCNRGGYVTTRDDAGIQQVVNCSELRREFNSLEAQEAAAREYLTAGLPEECRKAGCLPGWLR
jgi:hypothetical protein